MAKEDNGFIALGSVTKAHQAQKLVKDRGISASVGKISSPSLGCVWGIFVKTAKKDEVLVMLRASSFKIL